MTSVGRALMALGAESADVTSMLIGGLVPSIPTWNVVPQQAIARIQLPERFDLAVFGPGFFDTLPTHEHRLAVHSVVAHLQPAAQVIALFPVNRDPYLHHAHVCGLKLVDDRLTESASLAIFHRRTSRLTIHDLVANARHSLERLSPDQLAELLTNDRAVVLDTRTPTDRERFGVIPGSIHMPRTTLEWMCDPTSGYSHERIVGFEQCLVTVCNEGYSSSLAAASLQQLGFHHATDLVGGVMAWKAAGLPIEQPDHTRFS